MGVLPPSNIFFYTPSEQTKKLFFYTLCTGHYFCNKDYEVKRQRYDSFLVLYVISGRGKIETGGKIQNISEGSFAFIDCYKPHTYFTKTGWEILWMHFDGRMARDFYDLITKDNCCIISSPALDIAERKLQQVYDMFSENKGISEPRISEYITTLLTEFYICMADSIQPEHHNAIEEILPYISDNIDKPLTVEKLAKRACMSSFYFLRVFKKETGLTPHRYIIVARINTAKFLLRTTDFPIKKIALSCGYSNVCYFSSTFKKITGITPFIFRSKFNTK